MVAMILFLVLLAALLAIVAAEVIIGIRWLVKKQKKQAMSFKKNTILLFVVLAFTGGTVLWSQMTADTPPITDAAGNLVEGSIAALVQVDLNGRKEWISIRGENENKPVLLFLAGGPGGTQMAAVRQELPALEKNFTVVVWDQPGSGKSYAAGGEDLNVQTYIKDGSALTEYLCQRFGQEKIYLVGESWGSALGIFLAAATPGRYHAVIGTGQMVDFLETENIDYDKALEIAQSNGDTKKIEALKKNGRPPYYGSDVTWKSAEYLNYLSAYMAKNPAIQNGGYNTFRDIFSPEYGVLDRINFLRGIVTTFNQIYPQLYDIDLRMDYSKLEVPVYFFLGKHDINAPVALVEEYAAGLAAPDKKIVWFEHSGHSPWMNESDKFAAELTAILN